MDNPIPRVKVINPTEGWLGTEYYIDGKKIKNVKSVDFRVAVDEIPHFTFETIGLPDIDMSGDIRFKFTPETVQQAVIVLRNELLTKGTLKFVLSAARQLEPHGRVSRLQSQVRSCRMNRTKSCRKQCLMLRHRPEMERLQCSAREKAVLNFHRTVKIGRAA